MARKEQPEFHPDLIAFVLGGGTLDSTHLDGVLNHILPSAYWPLLYSTSPNAKERKYMKACEDLEVHKKTIIPEEFTW